MDPQIPPDNQIRYFARDRHLFGFSSRFHPAPIDLDGESWPTVEHYYQAQKSLNPAHRGPDRGYAVRALLGLWPG